MPERIDQLLSRSSKPTTQFSLRFSLSTCVFHTIGSGVIELRDDTYLNQVVMSDSIVLWRMSVVWGRARSVVVLGIGLHITTLGLNVANLVRDTITLGFSRNKQDTELVSTFGTSKTGLAVVFMSLLSNLCATILVGVKVWCIPRPSSSTRHICLHSTRLHRRQFLKYLHRDHRTLVERVMEILVDSGVVYTAIWVSVYELLSLVLCSYHCKILYCISFFQPITIQTVLGHDPKDSEPEYHVTAATYLDAAMAQITVCLKPPWRNG